MPAGTSAGGAQPLTRIALGGILVAGGVTWLLQRAGAIDVTADQFLAWALITLGGALVLGAWLGRPRGFLVLGVLTTAVLMIASAIDLDWGGGIGERYVAPQSSADVRPEYRLLAGRMHIDLSGVDLTGKRGEIDAQVGVGELGIEVPDGVNVIVDAKAGAGTTVLFGRQEQGTQVRSRARSEGTNAAAGVLYVHARVGAGQLEVARAGELVELTDLPSALSTHTRIPEVRR